MPAMRKLLTAAGMAGAMLLGLAASASGSAAVQHLPAAQQAGCRGARGGFCRSPAAGPARAAVTTRVLPPTPAAAGRRAPTRPFRVLQLNLCNSGAAACYRVYGRGQSVVEAYRLMRSTSPDVVTLNEICRVDALDRLLAAMRDNWPGDWVYASFNPAHDRPTGGPYRCLNGDEYGIGVLGHVPSAKWAGVRAFGDSYPDSAAGRRTQDTASDEKRVWLCAYAVGSYYGCTTHLESSDRAVAADECRYLMNQVIRPLRTRPGGASPAVVGGDLNLATGGRGVEDCVPPGWVGAGDGDVQHVLATAPLAIERTDRIPMRHTDHPAWLVALAAP
jgi:hypothetical protein